ncbi:P-loop containing nucleoside triphosphate hydrolase protein [Mycena latifolia]|nr:P-loop containing nucleoside triphosphate hydrolase protein [Mycena latifolia]
MKLGSTADEISGYRMRIQELRLNVLVIAAIDTNLQVHKGFAAGKQLNPPAPQIPQSITQCPPPSRIFHGRQQILDKMHEFFKQDLSPQHIFLLHGLGGAGKTQIALQFIQESSSRFSEIFLIDASTLETINTSLKNIAATKNAGSTAQDALQWLISQSKEWLLLFDNADDPKINLHKFFPQCTHGNILITSRNPGLRVYAGSHALVSDMEEADAVELLLKSAATAATPTNQEIAAEIVKALCYLPLAIIQAGAFISHSGALDQYLKLYAENRARLLSEKPVQSHDNYAWTVYTTWQISFDQLSKPAAAFVQLSHCPSKEEWKRPLEFLSQFLGPGGTWDSLRFMKVTSEISAYSLINFDPERHLFSIHPLVHTWSQNTVTDQQSYHYQMVAILGMSITEIRDEDAQLASLELLPHLDSLIRGGTNLTPDFQSQYGWIYLRAGRWKDAKQLLLAVLAHQRNLLGEDHPHTLLVMGRLAAAHWKGGELKEAEELETVVLEKRRKILGEDHPDTLSAMANLGATYHKLGQLKKAEELDVLVLKKRRKILGDDHPDTLSAMAHLGSTYHKLGQFKEAAELENVVLEKRRKILGKDHPATLSVLANLGSTYHKLGQFKKAEELELVVLKKRRKIFGEDHPYTLSAMAHLGSTYHKLGEFQEAEELECAVLEKRRKILGKDHPATLSVLANLGSTYHKLGKFKEAEELECVVLKKRRKIFGEDHPYTLFAMGNLGCTYDKLGQFKEAEELKLVILEKQRKLLGEDHPDTLYAMHNLAGTYYNQSHFSQAEQLYIELLDKQKIILGDAHPDTVNTVKYLAWTREAMANSEDH